VFGRRSLAAQLKHLGFTLKKKTGAHPNKIGPDVAAAPNGTGERRPRQRIDPAPVRLFLDESGVGPTDLLRRYGRSQARAPAVP